MAKKKAGEMTMDAQHQQALQAAGVDHARLQGMNLQQWLQFLAAIAALAAQQFGGGGMPPAQATAGQPQQQGQPKQP